MKKHLHIIASVESGSIAEELGLEPGDAIEEINGNEIVVKDVRSFIYRTERDFDARYVTRRFDLDKLATLDFAVSHWDGMEFVAHTMLSFGFEDGKHLALSVETRLPEGVEQGSVPGLYKQFNVIYILADEEDLFAETDTETDYETA